MRSSLRPVVVAVALVASPLLAVAQSPTPAERGRAILEANCARCHATDRSGDSPLAKAPPFRQLGRRYPIDSLAESLAEGIVTGHSDMPQFAFEPAEINAILAHLRAIAE